MNFRSLEAAIGVSAVASDRIKSMETNTSGGTSKLSRVAGWILSGLIAGLMLGPSAMGKFLDYPGKAEQFEKLGFTTGLMTKIGVVEVIVAIVFLIPRTAVIGAILIAGYMGGAIVTHLRIGDSPVLQIVFPILAWVALGLRDNRVFRFVLGR
jgi:uncharacterized membrane protein YphA (DoxX/SURF4 family)